MITGKKKSGTLVTFYYPPRYTVTMGTVKFLILVLFVQLLSAWFDVDKVAPVNPGSKKETEVPVKQDKPAIMDWKTMIQCLRQEDLFF